MSTINSKWTEYLNDHPEVELLRIKYQQTLSYEDGNAYQEAVSKIRKEFLDKFLQESDSA